MFTLRNIANAFTIFLLVILFADILSLIYSAPAIESAAPVVGLSLGVTTYFVSERINQRIFADQENAGQSLLQSVLPSGERLQAFTLAYTTRDRPLMPFILYISILDQLTSDKWYFIGASQQSLAIVQVKHNRPTGMSRVWRRSEVKEFEYRTPLFQAPQLTLQLPSGRMELLIKGYGMTAHVEELVRAWERGQT